MSDRGKPRSGFEALDDALRQSLDATEVIDILRDGGFTLAALPSAPDQRPEALLNRIGALAGHPHYLPMEVVKPLLDAARAALSEATTSPEATLDVERLARAIASVDFASDPVQNDLTQARMYAAEYARLRGPA